MMTTKSVKTQILDDKEYIFTEISNYSSDYGFCMNIVECMAYDMAKIRLS